ncbi:hypothetical protein BV898_01266 [Hypsibius exemplaris]|uniref:Transmembrane protein n=1 Tax=Hypsibius exemplaris TaxID=2072580 RepID=A0A1W0XC25_HYPEX|nr:hypothetical protein BV898_01266 [Hypsibius exemplaris]
MADIDLKALSILQEPLWWEPLLNAGMIFAALFQVVCIGFAVFGPDSPSVGREKSEKRKLSTGHQRGGKVSPSTLADALPVRRRSKHDNKKRR